MTKPSTTLRVPKIIEMMAFGTTRTMSAVLHEVLGGLKWLCVEFGNYG